MSADLILKASNISKSFGALRACSNIDLDIKAGEIHAIIGPNGAGKSTFIKQLTGEQKSDEGSVELLGQNINALSATKRARTGMARTFQISSLAADFSALENVMLAVQGASGSSFNFFKSVSNDKNLLEPAMEFLTQAGLKERSSIKASQLSHGERRQLEFAMALAMKPKVFLMDEPMAGIGPGGSKTLTGILDKLREQAPILLVEHDMEAVFSLADRITVLVEGRNFATGTVAQIRKNQGVRDAYLGQESEL
ncbi:MAG: ABC transporter ATP-binding protein [Nitratireductor sp.]